MDSQLDEIFKGKPEELKAARRELEYKDKLRDEAKKELDAKFLEPVESVIGNALASGRMVTKQEVENYVAPINGHSPHHYRLAMEMVDKHNDEILREQH